MKGPAEQLNNGTQQLNTFLTGCGTKLANDLVFK
jgi:hypothetical protein